MFPSLFKFGPVRPGIWGFFPAVALIPGLWRQVDQTLRERCPRCAQVLKG